MIITSFRRATGGELTAYNTKMDSLRPINVIRHDRGEVRDVEDEVACEEPLEIRVRGRAVSVTMRTPGHDEDLAAGFLLGEGIIHCAADVLKIEPCPRSEAGNAVNVQLQPLVPVDLEKLSRHVFASSSCGVCGKASIDAIRCGFPPIESTATISSSTLFSLPLQMRDAQDTFSRTGGLHAAALFSTVGELIVLREDIGRHNAVDKVLGYALRKGLAPLRNHVLLVSGRTSFEILQKALSAGVPILAAVSAPSSLAVEFAVESGQTLIGFLRDQRMNVYANGFRVQQKPSSELSAAKAAATNFQSQSA